MLIAAAAAVVGLAASALVLSSGHFDDRTVPVELLGAAGERLAAVVETAAYFVICEALTNVAKYAHANHATVRMQRVDGRLFLEISDDGIGGASPTTGSGLHGLSDRVAALNGASRSRARHATARRVPVHVSTSERRSRGLPASPVMW